MPTLKQLAGPFNRPEDDKLLLPIIEEFTASKKAFVLRDEKNRLATKKSTQIFIWVPDLKRGASPEDRGYITPKEMRTQCRGRDWRTVDWTLANKDIIAATGADKSTVSHARRKYAPHTINPNLRRK